ncbi:MAG: hypothetical protein RDV41_00180 [Planctomycetota bacterium]|nr:hypothetical protein [Planctomycetota bacterium]
MENRKQKNADTQRKTTGALLVVMALALALIAFFAGRALVKSPGSAGPSQTKGAAVPPNAGTAAGPGEKEISSAPECQIKEGVLPGGRKVTLVMRNASGRGRSADPSAPPYPFAIPDAQQKTWRMLKTSIMTLDFMDVDFMEIAAWLTKETGIIIQVDPAIADRISGRKTTMRIQGMCLQSCLRLILMMFELQIVVSEDGRIVLVENAPEDSANFRVQQELWNLVQAPEPGDGEPERGEVDLAKIEIVWPGEGRSTGPGEKIPLSDGIVALREITGLNIMFNLRWISEETLEKSQVELPPDHTSALAAISSMAEAAGLDYVCDRDVVMITGKEEAAKERKRIEERRKADEERRAKVNAILGKVISIGFESAPMCEVAPKLESVVGLPVITDEETWFSDMRVTIEPGSHTVKEALEEIGSKANVRWFVEPAAIYLVDR